MNVTGTHGCALLRREQVCIIWRGSVFYFPEEDLGAVIALLEALQQEILLKEAEGG